MTRPIILWDIDGTLVRGRGQRVRVRTFVAALEVAELEMHSPDAVFETLQDTNAVVETLPRYSTNSGHAVDPRPHRLEA